MTDIVQELKDAGIVKTGDFTLKSGEKSNLYFDFKGLVSLPTLFSKICEELNTSFFEGTLILETDRIVGVPTGGVPYASVLAKECGIGMLMVRDEAKGYGLQKQVEGTYESGAAVTLIEDVITTGGSVEKFVKIIEAQGLRIERIICILDREAGGVAKLEDLGYVVQSLFRMRDFLHGIGRDTTPIQKVRTAIRLGNISQAKRTNLIVALDVEDPGQFFQMLGVIGPYIAAVKTHVDIMKIAHLEKFIEKLLEFKQFYNFLVIEDRKYADIPAISLKQMERYQVARWADIVTVHGLVGGELVSSISATGVGIILIHQLSVAGNLIAKNSAYQDMVFNMGDYMAQKCDITGFVTQTHINGYLTFAPGFNLDKKGDGLGQTYTDQKQNADFVIAGRGITEAKDIMTAVERYRDVAWRAK